MSLRDVGAKVFFQKKSTSIKRVLFEEHFLFLVVIFVFFINYVSLSDFLELWWIFLLKAVLMIIATILYFWFLKSYDVSFSATLNVFSPLVLLILSVIFLGEVVYPLQIVGICLIVLSGLALETILHSHTSSFSFKSLIGFLKKNIGVSLLSFFFLVEISVLAMVDKLIMGETNVGTNLFFTSLIVLSSFLIYSAFRRSVLQNFKNMVAQPRALFVPVMTLFANSLVLFAMAIPGSLVSLILPLRRTASFFTILFGGFIFHEKRLKLKLFFVTLMICGIFLIAF
jgi:drug/metabolite transporter (DMT)-like permease